MIKLQKALLVSSKESLTIQPSQPYGHDVRIIVIIHCLLYELISAALYWKLNFLKEEYFCHKDIFQLCCHWALVWMWQNRSAINVLKAKCCICKLMLQITRKARGHLMCAHSPLANPRTGWRMLTAVLQNWLWELSAANQPPYFLTHLLIFTTLHLLVFTGTTAQPPPCSCLGGVLGAPVLSFPPPAWGGPPCLHDVESTPLSASSLSLPHSRRRLQNSIHLLCVSLQSNSAWNESSVLYLTSTLPSRLSFKKHNLPQFPHHLSLLDQRTPCQKSTQDFLLPIYLSALFPPLLLFTSVFFINLGVPGP